MLVLSFQVAAMLMEMVFGTEVQWQLSLLVFDFQAFYFIIRIVFVDISIINSNYYFLFHMVVEMALYRVLDLWFTSSYFLVHSAILDTPGINSPCDHSFFFLIENVAETYQLIGIFLCVLLAILFINLLLLFFLHLIYWKSGNLTGLLNMQII